MGGLEGPGKIIHVEPLRETPAVPEPNREREPAPVSPLPEREPAREPEKVPA